MTSTLQHAIKLTQELVNIASESSEPVATHGPPEAGVVEYLSRICQEHGVAWQTSEVFPDRHNFIARFPKPGAPRLLIMAHMDTVSAGSMVDPFQAKQVGDKILGRGSCDDKGPLATALATLLQLNSDSRQLAYDVTLVGSVDEECSMAGAAKLAKEGQTWDLCMALEPTGLQAVTAHKGVYRCKIISLGKAAHSSTPELGENAIMTMHGIIGDLEELHEKLRQDQDPYLDRATLAVTRIEGGTVINIIPESCWALLDIRILPNHDPKEISQTIRSLVGARGKVQEIFAAPAMRSAPADPHIQGFLRSLTENNLPGQPCSVAYATDCSQLSNCGPCLVWGPGDPAKAHQVDEYIEVDQIEKAIEVLSNFLVGPVQ